MYGALLLMLLLPAGLQEDDPDAQYRLEFERYEQIAMMTDPAARATSFMDFSEEGFDERLAGSVQGAIQAALEEIAASGALDALYPLADRWDSQTGEMTGAIISLQSAAGAGDHEAILKYGETFYAANPIVDVAELLAVSHDALGNDAKFLEHAATVIDGKGVADAFNFANAIYGRALEASDWDGAAEWARQFRALPSPPAGISGADWNAMQIDFQRTIARAEFEGGRYENAIREYQTLLGMNPSLRAMVNFYLGRSYFALGGSENLNLALLRFADAGVLEDATYSPPSMEMVYSIYEANIGSREGLDENVLAPARERMQ
jgi:tetratricopeptide (TPR) repeat protein